MKIKLKPVDGPSKTVEVDDTWTIQRLSIRHCHGRAVVTGFPPRALVGSALISETLVNGDLIRALNEWMNEATKRIIRKRERNKQRKAELESAEIATVVPHSIEQEPIQDYADDEFHHLVNEYMATPERGK